MDYNTVAARASAEYVEKRSRFIASLAPVRTPAEAEAFLAEVRVANYDARHNVFAYVLRGGAERFSDDGEPQGTAGMPALEVLRKRKVEDTAVVVTRYFGGILLGAPGLVRAYTHAAAAALDAAEIVTMRLCDVLSLRCGYDFYARADGLVRTCGGAVRDRQFEDAVTLELLLPKARTEMFAAELTELSGGKLAAEAQGEIFVEGSKLPPERLSD